ncbi:hypothetical protein FHU13_002169 [Methylobacterium sp. R2-1]|nr:hypothetical protein [Methylobacterium sp. R2-1]
MHGDPAVDGDVLRFTEAKIPKSSADDETRTTCQAVIFLLKASINNCSPAVKK